MANGAAPTPGGVCVLPVSVLQRAAVAVAALVTRGLGRGWALCACQLSALSCPDRSCQRSRLGTQ